MKKNTSIQELDSAFNNREIASSLVTFLEMIGQIPTISKSKADELLDKYFAQPK